MIKNQPFFSLAQWRNSFSIGLFVGKLFTSFGALWLIVEIATFVGEQLDVSLEPPWWALLSAGLLSAIVWTRPRGKYHYKLQARDVDIEIRIADAFDVLKSFGNEGALVVPVNTSFETNLDGVIPKATSVQGKLIREYYGGNPLELDKDIQAQLSNREPSTGEGPQTSKGQYEVGTVIQLNKNGRRFYLLVNSHIGKGKRVEGSTEEQVTALEKLWGYICEQGDKGEIVIPLVGTGHGRIAGQREVMTRHIVRTFIKSSSQKSYCNKLIVAIFPHDVKKHEINLHQLNAFLQCVCSFPEFE